MPDRANPTEQFSETDIYYNEKQIKTDFLLKNI